MARQQRKWHAQQVFGERGSLDAGKRCRRVCMIMRHQSLPGHQLAPGHLVQPTCRSASHDPCAQPRHKCPCPRPAPPPGGACLQGRAADGRHLNSQSRTLTFQTDMLLILCCRKINVPPALSSPVDHHPACYPQAACPSPRVLVSYSCGPSPCSSSFELSAVASTNPKKRCKWSRVGQSSSHKQGNQQPLSEVQPGDVGEQADAVLALGCTLALTSWRRTDGSRFLPSTHSRLLLPRLEGCSSMKKRCTSCRLSTSSLPTLGLQGGGRYRAQQQRRDAAQQKAQQQPETAGTGCRTCCPRRGSYLPLPPAVEPRFQYAMHSTRLLTCTRR